MLADYIKLLRVRRWLKNLVIFAPIFFAGQITTHVIWQVVIAFFAFSLFTSFAYIINDIQDVHVDRHNLQKRNRPLAKQSIKITIAIRIAVGCLFIGMALSFLLPFLFLWLAGLYVILDVLYSIRLKRITIINLLISPLEYLIRLYIGGIIAIVVVPIWLVIPVFLLPLIFVVLRRREETLMFLSESESAPTNRSVRGYSLEFLNIILAISVTLFLVSYKEFCIDIEFEYRLLSSTIYLSGILVLAGLLRYLQLVIVQYKSAEITDLIFKDIYLSLITVVWLGLIIDIIYFR